MEGLAWRNLDIRLAGLLGTSRVRTRGWVFIVRANQTSSYQRAFVDFFEDELVLNGYDWRKVLSKYLFEGKEPLVNCLISGCTS